MLLTLKNKQYIFPIGFAVLVGLGFFGYVLANPLFMGIFSHTGTTTPPNIATSTYALRPMSAGTGTTTLVYDSNQVLGTNQSAGGSTQVPDQLTLNVMLFASSTRTAIRINIEQSRDGIDWYSLARPVNELATTTILGTFSNFEFHFASTSATSAENYFDAGQYGRNFNRFYLNVPSDMRFTRATIWMQAGGMSGMIYSELVPKKQRPE